MFAAILTLAFPLTVHADTLQFVGTGSNTVGNVYAYPYYFHVNGSAALTPLMCLSFDNEIVNGESWSAIAEPLAGTERPRGCMAAERRNRAPRQRSE